MSSMLWEVVGGKKDGILVRTGKSIKTPEAESRLSCGSIIEQVELDGERLHYDLLTGSGPESGWVSLKLKGADLVVPASPEISADAVGDVPEEAPLKAPPTFPEAPFERTKAVVELRREELAALSDMVAQIVVVDGPEDWKVHVEIKAGQVSVKQGLATGTVDVGVALCTDRYKKLWSGVLDIGDALTQKKLYVWTDKDRTEVGMLVRTLLILEGCASDPSDGIRRPVPIEVGGVPRPSACPTFPEASPPDWLNPDEQPEKKKRILFLSIPWAGHIVHLRRIAEFFTDRPKYEVHFAAYSLTAPTLPPDVTPHVAEDSEVSDIFDVMSQALRLTVGMSNQDEDDEPEEQIKHLDDMLTQDGMKFLRFMVRVFCAAKPNIVVADSCYSLMDMGNVLGRTFSASVIYVNSPGIVEERMIPGDTPEGHMLPPYWDALCPPHLAEQEKAKEEKEFNTKTLDPFALAGTGPGADKKDGGNGSNGKNGNGAASGELPMPKGIPPMYEGTPPTPEEMMASGGWNIEKMTPVWKDLFSLPGFTPIRQMQFANAFAMVKTNPPKVVDIYPSTSWMVEQGPQDKQVFICPLLPLPKVIGGRVQVGKQALGKCLDKELLDWLFQEDQPNPVVYVAFGTIVKGFKSIVRRLYEALKDGPWRVLWALPKDMQAWLPGDLPKDRWRLEHFVNQRDVLRCERVKCFVSHCGHNSTIEAMSSGVPMVCHPFFMDQYEWARTVRSHLRAGIQVDKFKSKAADIQRAITEVLEVPSYGRNARHVARRLRAQFEDIKRWFGPCMATKADIGPGSAVAGAIIVALCKNKDHMVLFDRIHQKALA